MKITSYLEQAQETLFSFEILPPLKGQGIQSIFDSIDPLMEFKPPFIDVTYHREEHIYKSKANGLLERRAVRKRPGTVGICAAIMNKYQVDTVPHIICGGFNKEETENALIDLNFLGIDNVLVLRGDPIKSETYFKAEDDGHAYASELLQQVSNLNKGILLEPELAQDYSTDFCIGVAGYPEKHFEAPNMKTDLHYLKQKVDLGAEYIVTQLFFDNKKYFDFVKQCRDIGINVPIIPGIKPISTKKKLTLLPQRFYMDIPSELSDGISKCKDNKEARQFGVEWAIEQCKELKASGVPCLHFYTMGNSDNVYKIASELF